MDDTVTRGAAAATGAETLWSREVIERYEEQLAGFTLLDDRFMQVCLKGRADCLQHIVRAVLGDDRVEIEEMRDQVVIPQVMGRSVQLEFLCRGSDGRRFVVEFESTSRRFPARRARFYASMADAASLGAGQGYEQLADVVVVVFCPSDPFGDGLRAHTFRRVADETGSPMGDGSVIIYVSCKDPDGTPLGELAHDLTCADPDKMHSPLLADCVRSVKGRKAEVNALEEMYQIAMEDGLEQGLERGRDSAINDMRAALRAEGVDGPVIEAAVRRLETATVADGSVQ